MHFNQTFLSERPGKDLRQRIGPIPLNLARMLPISLFTRFSSSSRDRPDMKKFGGEERRKKNVKNAKEKEKMKMK